MRKLTCLLAAASLTAVSFAQTLMPANGIYYPTDANNQGIVRVEFNDSVAVPSAVIAYAGKTVEASVYEQGNTGRFWAVEVQEALKADLTENGTPFTLTVNGGSESVTGEYTYMPVFPLTDINPKNFTALDSKTETVTFSFDQNVTCKSIVVRSGDKTKTLDGQSGTNIEVKLLEEYWAEVTGADNSISIVLMGTLADGTYINNIADGEGLIGATYSYKETVDLPTFVGVDQDPYWWLAQDLFGMEVEFDFNAPVNSATATATVDFYRDSIKLASTNVTSEEIVSGQNWRTGNYYVAVPIPDMTETLLTEDGDPMFTQMVVTINGINAIGLTTPYSVTYDSEFPEEEYMKSPKKNQSAGINTSIAINNNLVDVYGIDGSLVKSNVELNAINSLGRGLYIVNGKKVLVK